MNNDSKAAGEVVIVLSEKASLTDLRLRLERVGVVFQASSVQVKGNVASGSRCRAPAQSRKSVPHFEDRDRKRAEESISKEKQKTSRKEHRKLHHLTWHNSFMGETWRKKSHTQNMELATTLHGVRS